MRRKITPSEKKAAVEAYLREGCSLRELGSQYGVHHSSVEKWIFSYESFGEAGLKRPTRNTKYSRELKEAAVRSYLAGGKTQFEVCKSYQIRSVSLLQSWIMIHQKRQHRTSNRSAINA